MVVGVRAQARGWHSLPLMPVPATGSAAHTSFSFSYHKWGPGVLDSSAMLLVYHSYINAHFHLSAICNNQHVTHSTMSCVVIGMH